MNKRRNFYEEYNTVHENSNKPLKIFLIIFIAIVVTGMVISGMYIMRNYDFHNLILSLLHKDEMIAVSTVAHEEEQNVQIEEQLENIKLEELNQKFVEDFKAKYPSVELSFLIKNLDTGATTIYNDKKMNSASVIKLFIMETVFDQILSGSYQISDERKISLSKMITESDNVASNIFIDDFGGVNENRKVDVDNIITKNILGRGYKNTELNRKMHNTVPPGGGLQGMRITLL